MGQPTTTPPGGGSWTWDDKNDEWVERVPEPAPAATPPAAQPAEQPAAARPATKTPQQPAAAADGQLNTTPKE